MFKYTIDIYIYILYIYVHTIVYVFTTLVYVGDIDCMLHMRRWDYFMLLFVLLLLLFKLDLISKLMAIGSL